MLKKHKNESARGSSFGLGNQTWPAEKSVIEFDDFPIKTSIYRGFPG